MEEAGREAEETELALEVADETVRVVEEDAWLEVVEERAWAA